MNRREVRSITALAALERGMHIKSLNAVIFDRLRECERRIRFTRSRAIRSHERLRRNSAARFGSCAVVVSHAAFRYPTSRTFAAWPDDWSFPRSSGGTHGVHPFAGFAPAAGGSASLHIRAHMPFSSRRPTRLIFVGLIRLARIA
jgi:hypothetical protein